MGQILETHGDHRSGPQYRDDRMVLCQTREASNARTAYGYKERQWSFTPDHCLHDCQASMGWQTLVAQCTAVRHPCPSLCEGLPEDRNDPWIDRTCRS